MIKAIGFDFGGVISRYTTEVPYTTETLGVDKDLFFNEYHKINHLANVTGSKTYAEVVEIIARKLKVSEDKIKKAKEDTEIRQQSAKIDQQIVNLIKEIKAKNYQVCLISNHGLTLRSDLDKNKLLELFDEIIISQEVGYQKPNPQIFKLALASLNIRPEEFIFIDDHRTPLETAKEIGYVPILYKDMSVADLKKELQKYIQL